MSADGPFGPGAPYCAPPDRSLRAPRLVLPAQSCDCHAHICGPESDFAYADERIYTPPDALLPDYLALLAALGVARTVLVQPSVYGADNAVLLAALTAMKARRIAARGVAVVRDEISDGALEALHEAGVRGLRFNLVDRREPSRRPPLEAIARLCARTARFGWHAEFLLHIDEHPELEGLFADFPVDIVLGHIGYARIGRSTEDAGFQAMLRLAQGGRCWIKLTGPYRIAAGGLPYPEAGDFARAAVAAAPERIVWGTDWPHVMVTKAMPNDADLCDLLVDWIPDAATRERVLVANPAALYGF